MKTLFLLLGLSVWVAQGAQAQSSCASDGQATPVTLVERFISADCEACWSAPQTRPPAAGALTLDWIVPGKQGDDAPLSAAASQDALMRLQTLGRAAPTTSTRTSAPVVGGRASRLRVAHGLPLGGYIGASIELKTALRPRGQAPLSAWLVLVETIPAGTDGTSTERNLIRNVLKLPWNKHNQLLKTEHIMFHETRPLSIPSGATPERLRVVGWVQDGRGRILTAAQSVCAPT
ncbi:MAG: hypothetical protein Q7T78_09150 [Rhodoferax sp.]|nr:hypothetical protein [Rhodoferax sp.]